MIRLQPHFRGAALPAARVRRAAAGTGFSLSFALPYRRRQSGWLIGFSGMLKELSAPFWRTCPKLANPSTPPGRIPPACESGLPGIRRLHAAGAAFVKTWTYQHIEFLAGQLEAVFYAPVTARSCHRLELADHLARQLAAAYGYEPGMFNAIAYPISCWIQLRVTESRVRTGMKTWAWAM